MLLINIMITFYVIIINKTPKRSLGNCIRKKGKYALASIVCRNSQLINNKQQ